MNLFNKAVYRAYQKLLFVGMAFMPWREPKILEGQDSVRKVGQVLTLKNKKKPLIVTDKSAIDRGGVASLLESLTEAGLEFAIFDGVLPNPTVKQIEEGLKKFQDEGCDSLLAFGGGSVIDCAKIVGARAVCPKKSVSKMKGLLKIRKKLPLFVAIPTTAGTGSEVTVAAVVTDDETDEKFPINDFSLIPHFAVLDPNLTVDLPPMLSATTGMDALTHAVEAYIGKSNTGKTIRQAEEAVKLIFENIEKVFKNGKDSIARQNMQKAAFLAGQAFTRAYVGYVHALAHALGGRYKIPHGLCNAVLLPVVLFAYGKSVYKPLARLADILGLCKDGSIEEKANEFIFEIQRLNEALEIPATLSPQFNVKASDLNDLARRAFAEANPLYPVPQIFDKEDLKALISEIA